jgi:hypothetical protein
MSHYLSQFYCGNTKNLCNYDKPINYSSLLNRRFDKQQYNLINNCKGYGKKKGLCCKKEGMEDPMDKEYMERINREFGHTIFHKNDQGEIQDSIPLIKTFKNENGEIIKINVCDCGGNDKDYNECVKNNCKDYKIPSRYEYCKMGTGDNSFKCFTDYEESPNNNLGKNEVLGDFPSDSNSVAENNNLKNNKKNKNLFGRCKLSPLEDETQYVHNSVFSINNIMPDCYLNLCNKDPNLQKLERVTPNNANISYQPLENNIKPTGFIEIKQNKNNVRKTINDFLK